MSTELDRALAAAKIEEAKRRYDEADAAQKKEMRDKLAADMARTRKK